MRKELEITPKKVLQSGAEATLLDMVSCPDCNGDYHSVNACSPDYCGWNLIYQRERPAIDQKSKVVKIVCGHDPSDPRAKGGR